MARYIDADKVMDEINRTGGHNLCEWETIGVKALIDRQPTADVVEVKHAKWIGKNSRDYYTCSNCCVVAKSKDDAYCRGCGAKMDGGKAE